MFYKGIILWPEEQLEPMHSGYKVKDNLMELQTEREMKQIGKAC